MSAKRQVVELRKHKRFRMNGNALAALYTSLHDFVKLGQIMDISKGGLAIRYVALGEQTEGSSELDLFGSADSTLHLEKVPCSIVYDMELSDECRGLLRVRRCGVQFGELSNSQISQLDSFIRTYGSNDERRASAERNASVRKEKAPCC